MEVVIGYLWASGDYMSAAKIPRVQRSVLESCTEWDLVTFNSINPLVVLDSLTSEQTTNSPMLHTICSHSITQDMMSAFQLYTSIVCMVDKIPPTSM